MSSRVIQIISQVLVIQITTVVTRPTVQPVGVFAFQSSAFLACLLTPMATEAVGGYVYVFYAFVYVMMVSMCHLQFDVYA